MRDRLKHQLQTKNMGTPQHNIKLLGTSLHIFIINIINLSNAIIQFKSIPFILLLTRKLYYLFMLL